MLEFVLGGSIDSILATANRVAPSDRTITVVGDYYYYYYYYYYYGKELSHLLHIGPDHSSKWIRQRHHRGAHRDRKATAVTAL